MLLLHFGGDLNCRQRSVRLQIERVKAAQSQVGDEARTTLPPASDQSDLKNSTQFEMPGRARSGGAAKASTDNRANQMNPNNTAYTSSRDATGGTNQTGSGVSGGNQASQAAADNYANQLNPNNEAFEKARAGN